MAAQTNPKIAAITITCKIVHKETGAGIPDLLVLITEAGVSTTVVTSTAERATSIHGAKRLGSALTDAEGKVQLEIERSETKAIILAVLAPEEPDTSFPERMLYVSDTTTIQAAVKDTYLIKLKSELLTKKEIALPKGQQVSTDVLSAMEKNILDNKDFASRKKMLFKEKIIADSREYKKKRTTDFTLPLLDRLSKIPKTIRDSKHVLKPGASVNNVNLDNIRDHLIEVFGDRSPSKEVSGFIYLSDADFDKYAAYLDPSGYYNLPDSVVQNDILPLLFRTGVSGSQNDFITDHPSDRLCRSFAEATPAPGTGTTTPVTTPLDPAKLEDVPVYVAHQMNTATSPEEQLAVGLPIISLEKRPTNEDIAQNIASTVFQKGPADVPAFYDFHSLKIAFENIWQETFDLGLIDKAHKWYDLVVRNGGDPYIPPRPTTPSSDHPVVMYNFLGDAIGAIGDVVEEGIDIATDLVGAAGNVLGGALGGIFGGGSGNHEAGNNDHSNALSNEVVMEFPEVIPIWNQLISNEKIVLLRIAKLLAVPYEDFLDGDGNSKVPGWISFFTSQQNKDALNLLRSKGRTIVEQAIERIKDNKDISDEYSALREANQVTNELLNHLKTKYSFKYYAANSTERSINFGVLLSYQQKWEPLNYQAGELVKTIPLAPKETRKFSKKIDIKKSRTDKEQEENLRVSKTDTETTSRAESEIVSKANNKTAFDRNSQSQGGVTQGPISGSNTTTLAMHTESERDSQQTKKDFHEAVVKASQEYKNERKIEITTEETYESEVTEAGEISNPNDELTVTYLFYELQRQFKISERLYRLRPVIMVAQELPAPHEIDEEWIISNDWIIKRVLLDDSFLKALQFAYIISGEKLLLRELERTVEDQRAIVKDLRQNVKFLTDEVAMQNALMMRAIDKQADIVEDKDIWDSVPVLGKTLDVTERALSGVGNLLGMGGGDDPGEAARIRREALTAAYERADSSRKELQGRLESETSVLTGLSKQLAQKRKEIIEKETHIARLKAHLKDNILYYMQAIWNYEPKDQRFFRLLDTKVPVFTGTHRIRIKAAAEAASLGDFAVSGKKRHKYFMTADMQVEEKTLKEVADLDTMIGYKGNYMIFPLNHSNILTDFMMAPYIDSEFGLTDPDNFGNWSLDDFHNYVNCLRRQMGDGFAAIEEELKSLYKQLIQDPLRNGDLITVPTGSLFIEALPGSHTILEYFKLAHRFEDVKKVQAENRWDELNNARLAARIITGNYEEAKVDKKIVIEGNAQVITPTD